MTKRSLTLIITSFIQGSLVLITEIAGAKIIAPYYGTSLYIWSVTLTTTLGALALGYYLGGRLSFRYKYSHVLSLTLSIGGILLMLLPFSAPSIIRGFEGLGLNLGPMISIFSYLFLPLCFLGMTSPQIIQALNRGQQWAGRIAGSIYAISTLGGIAGAMLSTYYLMPFVGITKTCVITGILIVVMAIILYLLGRQTDFSSTTKDTKDAEDADRQDSTTSTFTTSFLNALLVVSFVEGAMVMVIELTGAKILSTTYGASLFVWSVIFSITLFSLALGYYLGAWVSKKSDDPMLLFSIIGFGGLWSIYAPFLGESLVLHTLDLGLLQGAGVLASIVLFPSVLCMGMVSPIIIQYITSSALDMGKSSGRIFAISTIGGIISTLLTGFFLLPELGIRYTSYLAGGLLVAMSCIYFVKIKNAKAILGCFVVLALLRFTNSEEDPNARVTKIGEAVGILGEWKVLEFHVDGERGSSDARYERKLVLNGIDQTYSQRGFEPLSLWNYPHKLGAYSSIKPPGSRALLLGMGGGSIAHELVSMGLKLDIVELDENVKRLAIDYFNYRPDRSNMYIDDARHYIRSTKQKYDVVIMDLVIGEVQPNHVFSMEGFDDLKKIINDDALVIINFQGSLIHSKDRIGPLSIYRTLQESGFYVNHYGGGDATSDIFLLASLARLDYKKLLEYPRYNKWYPYEVFSYDDLIEDYRLDLSGTHILRDDRPMLENINSSAVLGWRKNKIDQNVRSMIKSGITLY